MRQSRTRELQKAHVRRNRDRAPPTKCSGAAFEVLRLLCKQENGKKIYMTLFAYNKTYGKVMVARLTVECFSLATHEPSRTTLAPSSLFRVGKILIYVDTDYHKLHCIWR